jgi:Ankyrin repeats (many copies)
MSSNDDTRDEELLARYRQASKDAPGPSDAVRAAILAESRRVADELAKQAPGQPLDLSRPAANDSRWKITAFGTAGAAILAALLFAPRYWENAPPAQVSQPPPPAPSAAALDQAKAEAPKLEELKPDAAPSYTEPARAPARQSPSDSKSLQEIVVTQAERKSSKTNAASSPQFAAPAATPPAARARLPEASAEALAADMLHKRADSAAAADNAGKPATLQSAVAQGDVAQAVLLLDQGAVIDARDEAGRTPLMLAVTQGRLEIVRLLLARGADPNAADSGGHTPLQQATKRHLQDVAALLEQAGAH